MVVFCILRVPFASKDVSEAEGMVTFSKEAVEKAAILNEQLNRLQEQIKGVSNWCSLGHVGREFRSYCRLFSCLMS